MTAQQLLARAIEATHAGDYHRAAEHFERAAALTGSPDDTAAALESAARLRLLVHDVARAAALVERADAVSPGSPRILRVRAELADGTGDAEARAAAWQAVAERGLTEHRVHALAQLGYLARARGDHAATARWFAAALDRAVDRAVDRAGTRPEVAGADDPLLVGELRLELAIAHTAAGKHDAAAAQLDALDASLPVDDDGLRSRVLGQRGVLAMARGDHAGALAYAERARDAAVARSDATTYLAAATLIANLHEVDGRLVDAYDTYLRTRESLADLLGEPGRAMVAPAIELFKQRLGKPRFDEVWAAWVARRRGS
jgi:tetratricopeptide (TPR) repeat protein